MVERFPRQFGKYVLLKSLTRGGMGEIYLAASGQTGGLNKLCVIKKVITEKADPAKVNRFLDEAKVVLRLSHANLVSTFDAGDVDGELFIAMELVEGKDLREIWNRCVRTRTRIPVDVALQVVRETARALVYVHTYAGLRLVHRDIAPPNILLSYFGEVKLTDFGLARSVLKQEHTAPGVVFGRASYLAPEQARGEVADARTDVYSLGIVLWELLTGQPYLQLAGLDPVTSLSLVRHPKTQPPSTRAPWIAAELDAIVMRALAADRTARFQSAEELRRALSDVMTRVAARADPERVAEFLRGLYHDVLLEEQTERELFFSETLPLFRGESLPESATPSTGVRSVVDAPDAPESDPTSDVASDGRSDASSDATRSGDAPVNAPGPGSGAAGAWARAADESGGQSAEHARDGRTESGVDSSVEPSVERTADSPVESLAVSARRARAGSQARRRTEDASGPDAPTKVWRKSRNKRRDDLSAQTFVGRVIDSRYRVRHRIGEGGMGTVYAAEHVEIGKPVAVKILHRLFSAEDDLVERFRREARAASRVGHPHIVDVSDFGTTEEGCAYFVMELLEGKDLADVLVQEGRLELPRTVHIVRQICQALEAAHEGGVIHRDLKPENIFLVVRGGQPDFVKVLDFGIASSISDDSKPLTNPGMAMGTPEYMAPEQSQGRASDRRTDVYAVGALLHEMVLGTAPFKASSQQAMFDLKKRPLESLRKRRPAIPAALDAIILRALDFDPDRRPQTMVELEADLARVTWTGAYATLAARATMASSPGHALRPPAATPAPLGGARGADVGADAGPSGSDPNADLGGHSTSVGLGPAPATELGSTTDFDGAGNLAADTPLVEVLAALGPTGVAAAIGSVATPPPIAALDMPSARHAVDDVDDVDLRGAAVVAGEAVDAGEAIDLDDAARDVNAAVAADAAGGASTETDATGVLGSPGDRATIPYAQPVAVDDGLPIDFAPPLSPSLAPEFETSPEAGPVFPLAPAQSAPKPRSRHAPLVATLGALVVGGGIAALAWTAAQPPRANPPGSQSAQAAAGADNATPAAPRTGTQAQPAAPPTSSAAVALAARASSAASASAPDGGAVAGRSGPEVVPLGPVDRARAALKANAPDDAIAVLRPLVSAGNRAGKPLLADALIASGWNEIKAFRWNTAARKAREALSLSEPGGSTHDAHALLGEALYGQRDFGDAIAELNRALAETPRDAHLRRRVYRARKQLQRATPVEDRVEAAAPPPSGPVPASASAPTEPTPEQ